MEKIIISTENAPESGRNLFAFPGKFGGRTGRFLL